MSHKFLRFHKTSNLGSTYNALALDIDTNFPFFNHDDKEYGKTDFLDLHSHMLFRKIAVEVYFSSFKCYYMANPDMILADYEESYIYSQCCYILTVDLGIKAYYIFNHHRYSA